MPAGAHPARRGAGGRWRRVVHRPRVPADLGWLDPTTGDVAQIPLGQRSAPHGVIVGPDGAPWITDGGQNAIVRVDPQSHDVQVFPLPIQRNANLNTEVFDRQRHVVVHRPGGRLRPPGPDDWRNAWCSMRRAVRARTASPPRPAGAGVLRVAGEQLYRRDQSRNRSGDAHRSADATSGRSARLERFARPGVGQRVECWPARALRPGARATGASSRCPATSRRRTRYTSTRTTRSGSATGARTPSLASTRRARRSTQFVHAAERRRDPPDQRPPRRGLGGRVGARPPRRHPALGSSLVPLGAKLVAIEQSKSQPIEIENVSDEQHFFGGDIVWWLLLLLVSIPILLWGLALIPEIDRLSGAGCRRDRRWRGAGSDHISPAVLHRQLRAQRADRPGAGRHRCAASRFCTT